MHIEIRDNKVCAVFDDIEKAVNWFRALLINNEIYTKYRNQVVRIAEPKNVSITAIFESNVSTLKEVE